MRRALASIRCSPADRPRLASRPARSRTTSTTWTRSPDASFSRFALYRCDQSRASSPPSTVAPQPISKRQEVFPGTKARSQDDSDRTHCHSRIPGRCWTSAFSVERVLCRMRFVVPVVTPVASHAGEGDQQEPRPGRSGCRRDLRSTSRSGPTARLPVPARPGLRPQPAGRARRECRGPGSRSSPTVRAGRLRARRPQAAPARGRTPAWDRPVARTPGRRPSRAGHGRSAGCGPGRRGAAGSGCSERPRHHSTITLSDIGGRGERARSRRSGRFGRGDVLRSRPLVTAILWRHPIVPSCCPSAGRAGRAIQARSSRQDWLPWSLPPGTNACGTAARQR
jgi:hypothetical protein